MAASSTSPGRSASEVGMPGRLVRLVVGLVLCGAGIGLMVRADLGLAPWSVLDQGLAERTGLQIGTLSIITGAIVLTMWVPLRQRPGIGTVANIVLIGLTIDAVLAVVDAPGSMAGRVAFMLLGVAMWGPGSGFYIGAGLGTGPRDGLMTGLHAKGVGSIRVVRTALEVVVLTVGWLLGGTVGIGTIVFALTIGPNVQYFLRLLGVAPPGRSGRSRPSVLDAEPTLGDDGADHDQVGDGLGESEQAEAGDGHGDPPGSAQTGLATTNQAIATQLEA